MGIFSLAYNHGADFGLGVLGDDDLAALSELLRPVRRAAGDF